MSGAIITVDGSQSATAGDPGESRGLPISTGPAAREPLMTYHVTIPGSPGPAKINSRMTPVKRGGRAKLVNSKPYRKWKRSAVLVMRAEARGRSFGPGPLRVEVLAFWPRQNRTGPAAGLALGDVDAVAKAVLDALQVAGVIHDDAQVVALGLSKAVSMKPCIKVVVRR